MSGVTTISQFIEYLLLGCLRLDLGIVRVAEIHHPLKPRMHAEDAVDIADGLVTKAAIFGSRQIGSQGQCGCDR